MAQIELGIQVHKRRSLLIFSGKPYTPKFRLVFRNLSNQKYNGGIIHFSIRAARQKLLDWAFEQPLSGFTQLEIPPLKPGEEKVFEERYLVRNTGSHEIVLKTEEEGTSLIQILQAHSKLRRLKFPAGSEATFSFHIYSPGEILMQIGALAAIIAAIAGILNLLI
ncbi:MAG: hypothetical protein ACFFGZ_10265 [Candidatus Thorarchaeota archaeon]